jgi:hypothetical protein
MSEGKLICMKFFCSRLMWQVLQSCSQLI